MAAAKKKSKMRDKVKKKAERNMSRGQSNTVQLPEGIERLKPKKVMNLDFLPYTVSVDHHPEVKKGEQWYQRTFFIHFNIGSENKVTICPKTFGKPCPICEEVKSLRNSDDENDNKLADSMKAKERELYNVIDLDNQDKHIQVFEYSYHLFGKALDEEINEGDESLADFAEIEGGKTLEVHFRKKKLGGNEFFEVRKIEFIDREEYGEDILNDVVDLDKCIAQPPSYEQLKNILYDISETDEDEDGDSGDEGKEEPASKKPSSKTKSSKKKKEPEPDKDDDDEGDGSDNEEEEKPKSEKSSGKKATGKKPAKSGKKKKSDTPECPGGGEFGVDTDKFAECDECPHWTECQEANEDYEEDE